VRCAAIKSTLTPVSSLDYDRVAVFDYIKQSVERMREMAKASSDKFSSELLAIADQIAEDAGKLEAELIASGYLPEARVKDRLTLCRVVVSAVPGGAALRIAQRAAALTGIPTSAVRGVRCGGTQEHAYDRPRSQSRSD
jgi:hypothetical protein